MLLSIVRRPWGGPFAVGAKTTAYLHFFFGLRELLQACDSTKLPVKFAPINVIATVPLLAAVIFFALLRLPNFAEKVAESGETTSAAATVGIAVGVNVAVAVRVAVAVAVAVGVADGVSLAVAVAVAVGVLEGAGVGVGDDEPVVPSPVSSKIPRP